jgi:thymidine phosphorylase
LAAGAKRSAGRIDHSVGLSDIAALGDQIDADVPLCMLHARSEHDADAATKIIRAAITLGDAPMDLPPTYLQTCRAGGLNHGSRVFGCDGFRWLWRRA